MNKLDRDYISLAYVAMNGTPKQTRNGSVRCTFGHQIRHNMREGFPLLTTKKVAFKTMATELTWFLRGETHLKYLHEHGCHIWDADAKKHGSDDLGLIYGHQWRSWSAGEWEVYYDQIQGIINTLNHSPDSRRMIVSAWNVGDLDDMALPPCHFAFQVQTEVIEGKRTLNLMWFQRSVDLPLGLPFNIASYGLLLLILAKQVDMVPGTLIGSLGDVHVYDNQTYGLLTQIKREPYKLPTVSFEHKQFDHYLPDDFILEGYEHHPAIKFPLST